LKILVSAVRFRLRAPIKTLVYHSPTVKNIIFSLLSLCLFFSGYGGGKVQTAFARSEALILYPLRRLTLLE